MDLTQRLSDHFTLAEAVFSPTASRLNIDNEHPPQKVIDSAVIVATKMEKVRVILDNKFIHVDSWIRCLELNRALKSKDTSQHIKGEAVDFVCPQFGSPVEICKALMVFASILRYDQLILEHTWVHISFNSIPNAIQKGQVLSLLSSGGYANGLTDSTGKAYA